MFLDTRNFSWAECEIRLGGRMLTGAQAVRWTVREEKEVIYGKGKKPLAIKSGNESTEGSISLLQLELEAISDASPEGKITKLTGMDIQIAFANDIGGIVRYSIVGVEFTEAAYQIAQNDKKMVVELPFIALDCKRR